MFVRLLKKLTLDQWVWIHNHYRKKDRDFDMRVVIVFTVSIVVMILSRYYGKSHVIRPFINEWCKTTDHPSLYPNLYWALFNSLNYFVLPFMVIHFVYKEKITDFGFYFNRNHRLNLLYMLMLLIVLPLTYVVSFSDSFVSTYPFYSKAGETVYGFMMWELSYGLQFLMLEFFFRGFMLFFLARYMGAYAIFVMTIPYTMIHFQKPILETMGSVIAGTALGTLALRTKSIYGAAFIHIAVAWSMDVFALIQKDSFFIFFSGGKQ